MKATRAEISRCLVALEATPRRLAQLTERVEDSLLQARRERTSWSITEILAHLRSCADLWTHSIYAMLAQQQPVLPDIHPRQWAKVTGYAGMPVEESLRAFTLQRDHLLRVLQPLPFEAWEAAAFISARRHTVFTQARRMAKHELEHCQQIEDLLKLRG